MWKLGCFFEFMSIVVTVVFECIKTITFLLFFLECIKTSDKWRLKFEYPSQTLDSSLSNPSQTLDSSLSNPSQDWGFSWILS